MSKQSEAKEAQGYSKKPASCGNCVNFRSDTIVEPPSYYWPEGRTVERKFRCGISGFAVGRGGYCKLWRSIDGPAPVVCF